MDIQDSIDRIAAEEGWSDRTGLIMLCKTLDAFIENGTLSREEVVSQIEEYQIDGDEAPSIGDDVEFEGTDTIVEVAEVPQEQPRAYEGIYTIIDQYGETHMVSSNGEIWVVEIPTN